MWKKNLHYETKILLGKNFNMKKFKHDAIILTSGRVPFSISTARIYSTIITEDTRVYIPKKCKDQLFLLFCEYSTKKRISSATRGNNKR